MPSRHRPPHPARAGRSPRSGRCSRRRRPTSARCSTRSAGPARGCRSGCRAARRWPGRPAPASSRGTPPCPGCCGPGRRRARRPRRATEPPGTILSATVRISLSSRASSSKPQAYVSSRSTLRAEEVPRGELVPLAADGLLVPAQRGQLVAQEAAEVGGGLRAAAAARAQVGGAATRAPGRRRRRRLGQAGPEVVAAPGRSSCRTAWRPRASGAGPRRGRCAAASSRVRSGLGQRGRARRPSGRRCWPRPPRRPVGIRSKMPRTACRALAITLSSLVTSPASYSSRARPSRSCMASLATRSRSSAGLDGGELGERAPVEVGQGGEAVGGEVGQLVVVPGDADVGGADRVERRPFVDVAVGDVVNAPTCRPYVTSAGSATTRLSPDRGLTGRRGSEYRATTSAPRPAEKRPDGSRAEPCRPRRLAARLPRARRDLGLELPVHQGRGRASCTRSTSPWAGARPARSPCSCSSSCHPDRLPARRAGSGRHLALLGVHRQRHAVHPLRLRRAARLLDPGRHLERAPRR